MTENNCIYIRGLGFKCRSGSRREQVLTLLKKNDESGSQDRWWIITGALCIGSFALGVVARYLGIL